MRIVLAHGHIFKNAGTTLDWSLRRNFGDGFLELPDEQRMREEGPRYLAKIIQNADAPAAISTHHLCQPLPVIHGLSWAPVFLLRHPLERVASVYYFERNQQVDTPGARAARAMSFTEYVSWRLEPDVAHTIRNYQAYYLAGAHTRDAQRMLGIDILPKALNILASKSFVGVVERYDESMVLLESHLRQYWPGLNLAYIRQNQSTREKYPVSEVLAQLGGLQQKLIDANILDLAVYQLARQNLEREIEQLPDFAKRLVDFRKRCRELATA